MEPVDQIVINTIIYNLNIFLSRLGQQDNLMTWRKSESVGLSDAELAYSEHLPTVEKAINLAAGHAKEDSYAKNLLKVKKINRLTAILEKVVIPSEKKEKNSKPTNAGQKEYKCYLPLQELTLDKKVIFPTNATMDPKALKEQYETLANNLLAALNTMPYQKGNYKQLVQHLLVLAERFLSQVPASDKAGEDVSLFDQLRTSAAIAEGLARADNDQLALVCGDFSGIQNFIYRITAKGAARSLRGRSLYIQLLCDGIADSLIKKLNCYTTVKIYASGGKFYLLISASLLKHLNADIVEINNWLLKEFLGDIYLGIGFTLLNMDSDIAACWDEATATLHRGRTQRFSAQLSPSFFSAQKTRHDNCQVCSKDDDNADIQLSEDDSGNKRRTCKQCRDIEEFGRTLANVSKDARKEKLYFLLDHHTDQDAYQKKIILFSASELKQRKERLSNYSIEVINNSDCFESLEENTNTFKFRWVGRWDKYKGCGNWKFEHFAESAKGISRMGILRMDVDNLGTIFQKGIASNPSFSRMASLSRQLDLFFAGYLNILLKQFERTQIIYSGGDDLFLIGSWDELPEVANHIRIEFSKFCADNSNFTLSGGLAIVGEKFPITQSAKQAGDAESKAKKLYRYRNGQREKEEDRSKNSFCMLGVAVPWELFSEVVNFRELIVDVFEEMGGNKAILDRLRKVVLAMDEYEHLYLQEEKSQAKLHELVQWQQWRWQLVYNLSRLKRGCSEQAKADIDKIQNIISEQGWKMELPVNQWLELPVRWAEFLTRKE